MTSIRWAPTTGRAAAARTPRSAAALPSRLLDKSRRPGDAGFTLIELLVCLVLLAAMSALVLPRFTAERAPSLQQRAQTVARDLAHFRHVAMGTGTVRTASSRALAAVLPAGIRIGEAIPEELVFLPNGMSNGGVWRLESEGRTVALAVDWLTGRVTVDAP
jgi:prepilin-type N-terminal cleavage/methylation domain-containing protein